MATGPWGKGLFLSTCVFLSFVPLIFTVSVLGQVYYWEDERGTLYASDDCFLLRERDPSRAGRPKRLLSKLSPDKTPLFRQDVQKQNLPGAALFRIPDTHASGPFLPKKRSHDSFYVIALLALAAAGVKVLLVFNRSGNGSRRHSGLPAVACSVSHNFAGLAPTFHVHYRDYFRDSTPMLGTVQERRKKDRGNNFDDLLTKARKGFSDRVRDPSAIFLLRS